MTYARIEGELVAEYPLYEGQVKLRFSDTSFCIPFEPPDGYVLVQDTPRPETGPLEVVEEGAPVLEEGAWKRTWVVSSASPELVAERRETQARAVRARRDQLLQASDWTQVPDAINAGANQDAWAAYRQRLREVSEQPEFPWTVSWPEPPLLLPPAAEVNYRLFYDALLVSPAYGAIRQRAVSNPSVLTACVEFIAAIGDAKAGRPNQAAIQACVDLLCAAAQFTEEELMALADVMTYGGLNQLYTLPAA